MQRLQALLSQICINQPSELFQHLEYDLPDFNINTHKLYNEDKFPQKINLAFGDYRDEDGNPYVFQVVKKVQNEIAQGTLKGNLNKEYNAVAEGGHIPFTQEAAKIIFGDHNKYLKNECIATIQTISGSGALTIGMEFIKRYINTNIYYPNPLSRNHYDKMVKARLNPHQYTYYDPKTKGLNYEGMKRDISSLSPGSIVLFYACAHNPTGIDPTADQWRELAKITKQNKLIPFFYITYQGFASGDLDTDAYSIRYFLDLDIQMIVAQSFSKNMGLYGERVGALHIVCKSQDVKERIIDQLIPIVLFIYISPPLTGARIAAGILTNPVYKQEWLNELKQVQKRITETRNLLKQELIKNQTPGNWDHITNQIGLYSYSGLTPGQCAILIEKYHVYLFNNGSINMTGINSKNVKYVAQSIKQVVENVK